MVVDDTSQCYKQNNHLSKIFFLPILFRQKRTIFVLISISNIVNIISDRIFE